MNQPLQTEKEILEYARTLIQNKKYDEAWQVLQAIPHHPLAQKWLTKLAEIVPKSTPIRPLQPPPQPEKTPKDNPPSTAKNKRRVEDLSQPNFVIRSFQPPRHPFWIGMETKLPFIRRTSVLATPFVFNIALANNWRNLGKPHWVARTLIMSLSLFLGSIFLAMGVFKGFLVETIMNMLSQGNFLLETFLKGSLCGGALGVNLAFILALIFLQYQPYAHWVETHDREALFKHPYDFVTAFLIWVAGSGVAVIIGAGVAYYYMVPVTYESEHYVVQAAHPWEKLSANNTFCADQQAACELVIGYKFEGIYDTDFYPIQIRFVVENWTGTLDQLEQQVRRNIESQPQNATLKRVYQAKVSQHPAVVIEYLTHADQQGEPAYVMSIWLLRGDLRYQISVYYESEGIYQDDQAEVTQILDALRLKP